MAAEEYEVDARLELNSPKVIAALDKISGQLRGLADRLRGANIGFKGLVAHAVALAATYLSFTALSRVVLGLGGGILKASSAAENMALSLATVYSAVEKISFKAALDDAASIFGLIQKMAIESPATSAELMSIFSGIYGPLRRAGLGVQNILDLTKNTAVAASALGIDYQQVQRDISMMARGVAGVDVKTFSLLQSMGLIKETTEQWNKLAPDKRAKRLMEAMGKMGGEAAEAYGRTWTGLSSTFKDIMDSFKRAFGTAVFARLKSTLERINKYLLENRELIESNLRDLGERVGEAFDHIVSRAGILYARTVGNIDAIRAKMGELLERFEAIRPIVAEGMKFAAILSVASFAFNTIAPIIGGLVSVLGFIPTLIGGIMSFAGMLSAAFGPILAAFEMFALTVSTAGLGGALLALGEIVLAAVAPFAIVVAVVAALVVGFLKFKDTIINMLRPLGESLRSIGSQLFAIGRDLWVAVKPILEVLGGAVIMQVIAQLRIMAWVLDNILLPPIRFVATILRWLGEEVIKPVAELLGDALKVVVEGFEWLAEKVNALVEAIQSAVDWIMGKIDAFGDAAGDAFGWIKSNTVGRVFGEDEAGSGNGFNSKFLGRMIQEAKVDKFLGEVEKGRAKMNKDIAEAVAKAQREAREKKLLDGKDRPHVVNDFRGSKIEVHQNFRHDDSERVWIRFRDALEREAVNRTQSGFVAPLTR